MAAEYKETDESKMTLRERIGRQNEQKMLEYYEPVMPKNPMNKSKSSLEDMLTSNMIRSEINDLQYTSRVKISCLAPPALRTNGTATSPT